MFEIIDSTEITNHMDEKELTGYDDPRWTEKSNHIKARDNYTCQCCHAINPIQGAPLHIKLREWETIHIYMEDESLYIIFVPDYDLTINIQFLYGYHLVIPTLNVHHIIYYRDRDLWDYNDNCLLTLCERCHHFIHSKIGIPIAIKNEKGQDEFIGVTSLKPYTPHFDHTDLNTFEPMSIVKENVWGIGLTELELANFRMAKILNKKWYDYHNIIDNSVVHIRCYMQGDKYSEKEAQTVADSIRQYFFEEYLGMSPIE